MAKAPRPKESFETAIAELEEIVRQMESGEAGLEQSLEQYQRGVELVRQCRGALDGAEQRIRQLQDGVLVDIAPTGDDTAER
ncbi:MAG: exodeoxyribonuclease VII small subunit [Rhodocyclaceae bacterium]|nr:exodeoxyribonuclease VII small subunit [Rhodocyclaceae bacterium]